MIIGTRGSALALAQTQLTLQALRTAFPAGEFSHQVIHTTGDLRQDLRLGRPDSGADKGVWTRELEFALAAGTVHVAVHSAKDVPTDLPPGFRLVGCLPRAAVDDVLISRHDGGFEGLPAGATVATSSVRRACQLRHHRPDVRAVEMRGNVPTRLQKLAAASDIDALVLARAGLDRLAYATPWAAADEHTRSMPDGLHASLLACDQFLPAAAQGIVAFEVMDADDERDALLSVITDAAAWRALRAEREFLRLLKAGCHTPVGLLTREHGGDLRMETIVFPDDGDTLAVPRTGRATGPAATPEAVAGTLFESLA